ncbi:unnamed protein product [Durusdinium trenchii]|uniref:JmjC domain-containing protein n=1 Tax=Durusdinium trenchii TaxID=1381693 RepID=A0ABP0P711_9DINO
MDVEKKARLAANIADYWRPVGGQVPRRRFEEVTTVEFLRDYVAMSQPLIFTDLPSEQWPCLHRWTDEYLTTLSEHFVSVNVTPNGRADAVDEEGRFVKPLEERMSFQDFWKSLSSGGEVLYLSRQNDSLREEFAPLLGDIPSVVPLAAEAFNNDPEAINLWIGEDRSVSSCHKDPYENLYLVVRGTKLFTLLPPASAPFLHEEEVPAASYVRNDSGQLEVVLDNPEDFVPWIPFDVADVYGDGDGRYADYGRFGAALAVEVSVEAGELLYLPAMWYHRVAQRGVTIAVNYWHDMQFGHNYLHHQFLRDAFGMDRYDDVEE